MPDRRATLWIKSPLAVFADGAEGGIVVKDGRIAELVPGGSEPEIKSDQTFDASEHVVLPGLVNTHHHFYQTLTRALGPALNRELFDWLKALYPVWAHLNDEMLATATELAMAELLLSGCTTTTDHHYVFPPGLTSGLEPQVEGASRVGIRAVLTRGSMNLSQKDGGLPPDDVVQDADAILADSETMIAAHHQPGEGAMIQISLAPCSPFSVTRELMRETAVLAAREGVLLHTHLAETEDENAFCLEAFGMRPLDYLEDCGWLRERTWLAHGIHFDAAEINRMAAAGVSVSSCPHSNMTLASGICPVCDMEGQGMSVGLGVDGSASNDASNMIEEVRQALMLQRLRYGSAKVSHLDALRWATEGSANCLNRTDIGRIAPGAQADLALFRLDELRYSGYDDALAALILCGASRADRVMVAGEWRVVDGRAPHIDEADLMERHSALARDLRERAGL